MLHPVPLYLALRYLRTKRKNRFASFVSSASVLGIALGVAVLVIVSSVMNGFEKEVSRHILGMTAHAVIFKPGEQMDDWSQQIQRLRGRDNVVAAAPFIRGGAMLNHKGIVRGVSVQGIEPDTERQTSTLLDTIEPTIIAQLMSEKRSVLLGQTLAEALEVKTGDIITLVAPRWSTESGIELPRYFPLTVIGTFSVGMHDFDAGFALLALDNAAEVFGLGRGVSGLRVKFDNPDIAPVAAARLAERLGDQAVSINWTQYHRNFFLALKSQKRMMFVILSLIVAIAAFNIVASMIMVVKEKERDIAVLRTLGLNRAGVIQVFLLQGVLIGSGGVALGIAFGAWGSNHAHEIVSKLERLFDIQFIKPDVYYINYLPSDLRLGDVSLISATAFCICVAATLYPAWHAARTLPAAALRYE